MEQDNVVMRVGEVREIELKGLSSAGYAWTYQIFGDSGAVSIEHNYAKRMDASQATHSLNELFTIHALGEGKITIHLSQRRSWETDRPARAEREVKIEIGPRGSLAAPRLSLRL